MYSAVPGQITDDDEWLVLLPLLLAALTPMLLPTIMIISAVEMAVQAPIHLPYRSRLRKNIDG